MTKIITDSQVSIEGQDEDLKTLVKLVNSESVNLNKHFDYMQGRIKRISGDPETREKIILYGTGMLGHEQATGKVGYEQGIRHDVKQGGVDSAKIILENRSSNGRTLKQATEFVKKLKLISDKDLEELTKIYKQNCQKIILKTTKD